MTKCRVICYLNGGFSVCSLCWHGKHDPQPECESRHWALYKLECGNLQMSTEQGILVGDTITCDQCNKAPRRRSGG